MPSAFWSGRGGETSPLCFRRQVVMDHRWESAALSAYFQIRSHQDMPTHSCCDKGAALHADHAVPWWHRSPACAWSELLKIRLMDGPGIRHDVCTFQRKTFLFRFSWTIKTLSSSAIILLFQQIFKGNELNNILQGLLLPWFPKHTTIYSGYDRMQCVSVSLFHHQSALQQVSSSEFNCKVIFFLFIFLKEAANRFHWSSLSYLASILGVGFWWWIEFQRCPNYKNVPQEEKTELTESLHEPVNQWTKFHLQ